jgi:hypothetical protein
LFPGGIEFVGHTGERLTYRGKLGDAGTRTANSSRQRRESIVKSMQNILTKPKMVTNCGWVMAHSSVRVCQHRVRKMDRLDK